MKLLLVEDDRDICEILEFNLLNEGFMVECAHSAEEGLKILNLSHSMILLDVMMGGISGYKMAEKLRKENNTIPIIFLTAKDTENDMLTGFSVGADDYISKPFSIKEVIARVRAVGKRLNASPATEKIINTGKISINLETKEVTLGEEKIALTKTEFRILVLLAQHPERVFSRDSIIENVWGDATFITERTVDVHITRMRKKLGEYGAIINNRSGYGYRIDLSKIQEHEIEL